MNLALDLRADWRIMCGQGVKAMRNSPELKNAEYAKMAISTIARKTKQASARIALAKAIPTHGNYTTEAEALWAEYLSAGCPAA